MSFFTYIQVKHNGDRNNFNLLRIVTVSKHGFDSNLAINMAVMGNNALCM